MKRTKEQLYEALQKAHSIIAQQAKDPEDCRGCIQKEEYLQLKDLRIESQGLNLVKFMKENNVLRTFIKEVL
jgi:hypothetical protein